MLKLPAIGLFSALALVSVNASAVLIDNFDSGTDGVGVPAFGAPVLGPSNTAAGADAIGGSRTLEITSAPSPTVSLVVDSNPNFDQLALANGPGATSVSTVTWDANGAGLGGADLILAGTENNDALQLDILSIDQGAVTLEIDVVDTLTGSSTLTLAGLGVGNHAFDFSNFVGTADFTTVNSIVLTITAGNASDLTLDLIQTRNGPVPPTVPVPGTLFLMGAVMLGLGSAKRLRK